MKNFKQYLAEQCEKDPGLAARLAKRHVVSERELIDAQFAEIERLRAVVEAARKVKDYGRHNKDCPAPRSCSCGVWELQAALAALDAQEKK